MNIKLKFLSYWTPDSILINELERLSNLTNTHFNILMDKYSISPYSIENPSKGKLEERRAIMAANHNLHVNILIETLGFKKALKIGRTEMFKAGYILGCETKKRLNIDNNINETIATAHILYKVLGVKFTIKKEEKQLMLKVKSCALANHYTSQTCEIMSAADEGVLKGLNNKMDMKFLKRITDGSKNCEACINIEY
ncbi:MAG: hypothetical protein PHY59_00040 [Methanobacterium sp.]|nr:hypothetical protein [Methanobacterium sp.]